MRTSRWGPWVWAACGAWLALTAAAGGGAVGYVRKATARASWEASLAAKAFEAAKLGPWSYAGPFDRAGGFNNSHVGVRDIDLGRTHKGKGGRTVRWQRGKRFTDGKPNDLRIFRDNDQIAVYLYRPITAAAAGQVPAVFGSDDGIVVWLNGRRLLSHNTTRACRLGDEKAVLPLRRGRNELLIKICNGSGPSGFAFALGQPGSRQELLLQRLAEDFPPEEVHALRVELDWLVQDKLTGPTADFRSAAAAALELTRATLASVSRRTGAERLAGEVAALAAEHARAGEATDWRGLYLKTRRLRRRIALADPLLDFERLLIVKRGPPAYSHMCDQYLGRHSRPGEGLVVLESWRTAPRPRPMLPAGSLPPGTVLHPDLSFDGRRVLFSFCDHTVADRRKRRFHIWEAATSGGRVRQLTGVPGVDPLAGWEGRQTVLIEDFDPCWLPDGGFAFVSTRNQAFGRCHGGRYTPSYVLYRADADGSNIRRISFGEANEWAPSVMGDGRLVYCRWDYINRHDTIYQSLWTTRPDGSAAAILYGNNTRNPCMTSAAKAIAGSHKIACLAVAHHAYSAGSIIVLDASQGTEGSGPIRRITPEVRFPETEGWSRAMCATPWPLSEEVFLTAYSRQGLRGQGRVQELSAFGIYLVDAAGGRELIYRDPTISCFSPIPLRPRRRPAALPAVGGGGAKAGVFFCLDVYRGLAGVERPSVKRLRVVRLIPQPTARVPRRGAVSNEIVKAVLGTVPVGADGSTAFRAPPDEPLLFQLLDANDMSVMSMRSQVYLRPGESASCVGCHEGRNTAPPVRRLGPMKVHDIAPPPGPRRRGGFSFARTVQPVLDRYCIRCHAPGSPGGKVNLLGEPAGGFNAAYESLTRRRGLVSLAHRNRERAYSTEKLYGAHAGRLAPMLLAGHRKRVKLDRDSFRRIAQWLDLNGQYYGDYSFRRRERRRPDAAGTAALRRHLTRQCGRCHEGLADQPLAALVNVAAPAESRVLMAPLARGGGGWGQCRQLWPDRSAKGFRELWEKVLAATGPPEAEKAEAARK